MTTQFLEKYGILPTLTAQERITRMAQENPDVLIGLVDTNWLHISEKLSQIPHEPSRFEPDAAVQKLWEQVITPWDFFLATDEELLALGISEFERYVVAMFLSQYLDYLSRQSEE